jgi:hypothetical protein
MESQACSRNFFCYLKNPTVFARSWPLRESERNPDAFEQITADHGGSRSLSTVCDVANLTPPQHWQQITKWSNQGTIVLN